MKEQLTILGIPGSLRRNSFNHGALRAAQQQTPEGVRLDIYELTDIPLFNADVEVSDFPATARDLQERIRAADGLLIVTPEYLHSIPGVLKNAIDWASRGGENSPLRGKPVAMFGAAVGESGTRFAQSHLRLVCMGTEMIAMNQPEVYITNAREKFDEQGNLLDEATHKTIGGLLDNFARWIRRLQP